MIQSVDRAGRILHLLATTPSLPLADIALGLGLAKPTVHGLLRTLEHRRLVRQDVDTGHYRLGPGVLELGNAYLLASTLRARSVAHASALAQRADERVWVAELVDDRVLVVHDEFRPEDTIQVPDVGATIPWYACAVGLAIVAFVDDELGAALLRHPRGALTGRTKTTVTGLNRTLARVRRDGFALENQEANVGEAGIAAPILDRANHPVGSIGLVGPVERLLAPNAVTGLAHHVIRAATAVSREMGATRSGRS